ncbi:MAG: succinate dehydrogenase, cytochrome b556 subunit [Betaproteobacteria bacterium]|nr:succinate dehydrogenase, cytochrome b556 subunit [Betaproteobacteria bacterium]
MANQRPKHLNLFKIKLPLPGVVSLLHRMSGALLFVAIPLFLLTFQATLDSAESLEKVRLGLASPLAKLILISLLWGFLHHFFAGVRFLLMDAHVGLGLQEGRRSSMLVLIFSGVLTLLAGVWLW